MAAQYLRSHLSEPQLQRFTLVFKNGELLRHQDHLAVAQYQSDARLARIQPEIQRAVWIRSKSPARTSAPDG
jgi:hypothetical protein